MSPQDAWESLSLASTASDADAMIEAEQDEEIEMDLVDASTAPVKDSTSCVKLEEVGGFKAGQNRGVEFCFPDITSLGALVLLMENPLDNRLESMQLLTRTQHALNLSNARKYLSGTVHVFDLAQGEYLVGIGVRVGVELVAAGASLALLVREQEGVHGEIGLGREADRRGLR